MSDEEHCVVNLISKIQYLGYENIPDEDSPEFFKFFRGFRKDQNGEASMISYDGFKWMVRMAIYVVYCSTVMNKDFSNMERKEK